MASRTYKYEEFQAHSGLTLFIEQYAEKPNWVKYWMYGSVDTKTRQAVVWSKGLLSRPNKKRLIENY
jgi:hypothetical protein